MSYIDSYAPGLIWNAGITLEMCITNAVSKRAYNLFDGWTEASAYVGQSLLAPPRSFNLPHTRLWGPINHPLLEHPNLETEFITVSEMLNKT